MCHSWPEKTEKESFEPRARLRALLGLHLGKSWLVLMLGPPEHQQSQEKTLSVEDIAYAWLRATRERLW